jgi:hypothetical protein
MPTDTDTEVTKTACFRGDIGRIKELGERIGADIAATLYSQHVVTRALDALKREIDAADAAKTATEAA